jgi:Ca2+-binding RTX toxin-like protein
MGGAGDDAYYVDAAGDVIIESEVDNTSSQKKFRMGNNNDVVIASVSYTLTANAAVEDMIAVGPATGSSTSVAINLTGNDLGQGLIGNEAANVLKGNGGDDALIGMGGNDTLIGGTGDDFFFGGAGNDSMIGGAGKDVFFFNIGSASGTNFVGQQGSIFLTGGHDTMDGGAGSEDTIVLSGSLSDYTLSKISSTEYKISAKTLLPGAATLEKATFKNIERLGFISSLDDLDNDNGSSTLLSSLLITSAFNDTLNGGVANDTLNGGAGNDTLTGGAGDDYLSGGEGRDVLTGGTGADQFVFDAALSQSNFDTVSDFIGGLDKIVLNSAVFSRFAIGANFADHFSATGRALDADDYLIYRDSNKTLYYDADGNGSGPATAFVVFTGVTTIAHTDFLLLA